LIDRLTLGALQATTSLQPLRLYNVPAITQTLLKYY